MESGEPYSYLRGEDEDDYSPIDTYFDHTLPQNRAPFSIIRGQSSNVSSDYEISTDMPTSPEHNFVMFHDVERQENNVYENWTPLYVIEHCLFILVMIIWILAFLLLHWINLKKWPTMAVEQGLLVESFSEKFNAIILSIVPK